jgi:hypothetical protein
LPEGSWTPEKIIMEHEDTGPVIPRRYALPPQKPIIMPLNVVFGSGGDTAAPTKKLYVAVHAAWVSYFCKPSTNSETIGRFYRKDVGLLVRKYNSWWYEIDVQGQLMYITTNPTYTHLELR